MSVINIILLATMSVFMVAADETPFYTALDKFRNDLTPLFTSNGNDFVTTLENLGALGLMESFNSEDCDPYYACSVSCNAVKDVCKKRVVPFAGDEDERDLAIFTCVEDQYLCLNHCKRISNICADKRIADPMIVHLMQDMRSFKEASDKMKLNTQINLA